MFNILNRNILKISGEDKEKFLQGLITNDINLLKTQKAIYSLFLTPQGKFLHDFFIYKFENDFLLDVDSLHTEELFKKLSFYKLRMNITIVDVSNQLNIIAADDINGIEEKYIYDDPRNLNMPKRILSLAFKDLPVSTEFYEDKRLDLGIPEGYKDMEQDKSFPLEFGMDKLNAISFNKGCYVGQELTTRTKFRGTIRKKVMRINASQDIFSYGELIYINNVKIGQVLSSKGNKGLALIRIEEYVANKNQEAYVMNNQNCKIRIEDERV